MQLRRPHRSARGGATGTAIDRFPEPPTPPVIVAALGAVLIGSVAVGVLRARSTSR